MASGCPKKGFVNICPQVRVYSGIEDEDPSSHLVGDEALAVACSAGSTFFVSAADNNNVQAWKSDDLNVVLVLHIVFVVRGLSYHIRRG